MKKQTPNEKIRKAYYETIDGISLLKEAVKDLQDEELIQKSQELDKKLSEIRDILDSKYLWD